MRLKPLSAGKVSALFHATYWKILRVSYKVTLDQEEGEGHSKLQGRADLGTLAGVVYDYSGEIRGDHFECTYSCKYDHGRFHLMGVTGESPHNEQAIRSTRERYFSDGSRGEWSPKAINLSRTFNRLTPSQRAALAWLPPAK